MNKLIVALEIAMILAAGVGYGQEPADGKIDLVALAAQSAEQGTLRLLEPEWHAATEYAAACFELAAA